MCACQVLMSVIAAAAAPRRNKSYIFSCQRKSSDGGMEVVYFKRGSKLITSSSQAADSIVCGEEVAFTLWIL